MRPTARYTRLFLREHLLAGFDRPWERGLFALVFGLVVFLYPFGLLFVAGGVLPAQYSWTASLVISLNALATLVSEMRVASTAKVVGTAGALTGLLFGIEMLGVQTGLPFGAYEYTEVLGFQLLGIPVAIPLAWYTTIILSWRISEGLVGTGRQARPLMVCLGAALLTVALDISLEPMAAYIKMYWNWEGGVVPLQNYLSWFGLSAMGVYLLAGGTPVPETKHGLLFEFAALLYAMQFILFSLTAIVHGQVVPVIVAIGLSVGVVVGWGSFGRWKILWGAERGES